MDDDIVYVKLPRRLYMQFIKEHTWYLNRLHKQKLNYAISKNKSPEQIDKIKQEEPHKINPDDYIVSEDYIIKQYYIKNKLSRDIDKLHINSFNLTLSEPEIGSINL